MSNKEITALHVEFLKARGYVVGDVEAAKKFVVDLGKSAGGFFADFEEWLNEKAVPKTAIEVIDRVVGIVHDILGTALAYEHHIGEVTQEERHEIARRIGEALTPGLDQPEFTSAPANQGGNAATPEKVEASANATPAKPE